MQHITGSFQSSDHLKIYTVSWLPQGEAKAVVVMVHGYGEHIGRYPHVAALFVEHGYAVYGLDHRGHGKSEGLRAHFDDFDQPMNDLTQYFESVKAAHPGKKLFMYGHSMGSLIALEFALRHQDQLAGLIITGTAVNGDATIPGALIPIVGILKRIIPKMPLLPALPASALSHDTTVTAAYDSDPLVWRGSWRVNMGYVLLTAGRSLRERAPQLRLPLLVMHGADDQVVPASGSQVVYERAGSVDKTLKIYPGLYHEVHNELDKATVLMDMVEWLDAH